VLNVNFRVLELDRGGKPGGQKLFEDLIVDLVGGLHPTARSIEPNPGDWGIDVIVGDLSGRSRVHIWQAKFFIDGCGQSQQRQIRDAYTQAVTKAKDKKYKLVSWTLCIPVAMEPDTARWWDGWVKRQSDGVKIDLWQENHLRRMLMADDNRNIYQAYFEPGAKDAGKPRTRRLEELDPAASAELDSALFMRQMREARLDTSGQLTAAKHAFFNAELVTVDVENRGVPNEVDAMIQARSENHSLWSADFGAARQQTKDRILPGLHSTVVTHLREFHDNAENALRLHFVHREGVMHQLVDDAEAGWVADYEQVARDHGN
jgi:hypothetical protein